MSEEVEYKFYVKVGRQEHVQWRVVDNGWTLPRARCFLNSNFVLFGNEAIYITVGGKFYDNESCVSIKDSL